VGHVINRREIRDFYVGADVFVYPSFAETFGLTLLESMACGTPVVASNRTSIPEVAGNAAVLVDPDDLQGFTRALGEVLTDVTLRTSLIKRGLQRAQEFTWDRTAAETLKAYQLALDLRNGNART
jgi:glycosyltransferase involved in cell wall biosynthesis